MAQDQLIRADPHRQLPKYLAHGPGADRFNGKPLGFPVGLGDNHSPLGGNGELGVYNFRLKVLDPLTHKTTSPAAGGGLAAVPSLYIN